MFYKLLSAYPLKENLKIKQKINDKRPGLAILKISFERVVTMREKQKIELDDSHIIHRSGNT